MLNVPGCLALTWCVIGYMFLDRREATGAIIASMASISLAWFARQGDVAQGRAPGGRRRGHPGLH